MFHLWDLWHRSEHTLTETSAQCSAAPRGSESPGPSLGQDDRGGSRRAGEVSASAAAASILVASAAPGVDPQSSARRGPTVKIRDEGDSERCGHRESVGYREGRRNAKGEDARRWSKGSIPALPPSPPHGRASSRHSLAMEMAAMVAASSALAPKLVVVFVRLLPAVAMVAVPLA